MYVRSLIFKTDSQRECFVKQVGSFVKQTIKYTDSIPSAGHRGRNELIFLRLEV